MRVLIGAGHALVCISVHVLQNVEEHQVREVLKCIIHTIIFNRALGHVSPRDMDLQLINVSYVEVADDDIERLVEEGLRKVEAFLKTLKTRPSSASSGKVLYRLPSCVPAAHAFLAWTSLALSTESVYTAVQQ